MTRHVLSMFLLTFCGLAGSAQTTRPKATSDWPEYGGTLSGQRYSERRQITPQNVGQLQAVWTFHTHMFDKPRVGRPSFEATPILWNRTLYFDTPFNEVFAIDAATGLLRWKFDPELDPKSPPSIVTSRGVAMWHAKKPSNEVCGSDTVLVATTDRRLIARDASTGAACPKFGRNGTVDLSQGVEIGNKNLYSFTSPATVVGETIVLGSSVVDNEMTFVASGAVRGFDGVTGRQKWSWDPVRWTAGQHLKTAGSGNAWSELSADSEHDLVFVPTGSASVDFYGGMRRGDNRDADSIVALRASTGERVWGFQLVHHDLWDYDTPSQPLLFAFRGKIPAVAVTTKTNMVYVFNRLTGEPLYPVEERAVPASQLPGESAWPTQPFSTLPSLAPLSFTGTDLHMNDPSDQKFCTEYLNKLENHGLFTPPSAHGSLLYPGSLGGANWGSSAFDPVSGVLYTRVSTLAFAIWELRGYDGTELNKLETKILSHLPESLGGNPPRMKKGLQAPDGGGEFRDTSPQFGSPFRLVRQAFVSPNGVPCAPQPFGSIVAINLNTGTKVWTTAHGVMAQGSQGSIGVGGPMVTAGGLVFAASTNDPYLRAYDSASGREVWRQKLPAPANATPMSYAVNGRQYVVIAAGGHGALGEGKSDEVIAYALPESQPVWKHR